MPDRFGVDGLEDQQFAMSWPQHQERTIWKPPKRPERRPAAPPALPLELVMLPPSAGAARLRAQTIDLVPSGSLAQHSAPAPVDDPVTKHTQTRPSQTETDLTAEASECLSPKTLDFDDDSDAQEQCFQFSMEGFEDPDSAEPTSPTPLRPLPQLTVTRPCAPSPWGGSLDGSMGCGEAVNSGDLRAHTPKDRSMSASLLDALQRSQRGLGSSPTASGHAGP